MDCFADLIFLPAAFSGIPFDFVFSFDSPVKSQRSDDKVERFRCKAHKYEGMRHTYSYAAMSKNECNAADGLFTKSSVFYRELFRLCIRRSVQSADETGD